jgi:hypothetical protein
MDKHDFISNRNGRACLAPAEEATEHCDKPPEDAVHWQGKNPYYLMLTLDGVVRDTWEMVVVDLDRGGWLETLKEQLGRPGDWHLVRKEGGVIVFSMRVNEDDQPYYTARHIGMMGLGESIAYSIGKKTKRMRKGAWHDNEDNLWVLENKQVCGGTDVEHFVRRLLMRRIGRV